MEQKQNSGIYVFNTVIGSIAILWDNINGEEKIIGIRLKTKMSSCNGYDIPAFVVKLSDLIKQSLKGKEVRFPLNKLNIEPFTDFQKKVLLHQTTIKRGSITTYGQIAKTIGHSGASRAVGNTLAMNPFPIIIPCHRTIRANGDLGGFRYGKTMKRKLLEMEGIRFNFRGKVLFNTTMDVS